MFLIGLDIGSTKIKAMLLSEDGEIVRNSWVATPTHTASNGDADYDADEMVETVLQLLEKLVVDFPHREQIAALSFASMAESGVAIDADGKPLATSMAWFDRRPVQISREIQEKKDPFELYRQTGAQLSHIPSLSKILWEKEHTPAVYRKTDQWVFLCNYIAFCLTGECATDPSQACRSMAYDIHSESWSTEICSTFDIDASIFPPIMQAGTVLGNLRSILATRLNLSSSLQVVMGGHDHPCGALSTGLTTPHLATNSSGTVDNALTLIDPAQISETLFNLGVSCGKYLVPGTTYTMGGIQGAGRAIEWFMENFYKEHADNTPAGYAKMIGEAELAPLGSRGTVFMPHLRGSIVPHKSPVARGTFLGLSDTHQRGDLARAVFEGLAMEYRMLVEGIENGVDGQLNEIRCFGGGSQNMPWVQIKADVLNRPFRVYRTRENTCLGAAVLAGLGCGCFKDIDDAVNRLNHQTNLVEPDPDHAGIYDDLFNAVYKTAFQNVGPVNERIDDWLNKTE